MTTRTWTESYSPFGNREMLAVVSGDRCPDCGDQMERLPDGMAAHRCAGCGLAAAVVTRDVSVGGYHDADGDWQSTASPYQGRAFWMRPA